MRCRLMTTDQRLGGRVLALWLILGILPSVVLAATTVPPAKTKEIKSRKNPLSPQGGAAVSSMTNKRRFGIGIGLFNLFLPQPALQASYFIHNKVQAGIQLGYLTLPFSTFSAQASYMGGDIKYLPSGIPFFFGLAAGVRTVAIMTTATTSVNNVDTQVSWKRAVRQTVIIPRLGWVKIGPGGTGTTLSLGYLLPMNTDFSITADPDGVPGFPADQFAAEREQKGNDLKKYTNVGLPHLELSYFWYLDGV